MAKKEVKTDLWVYDLLKQAEISLDAQGSNIKEIDEALKTASKKGTGNVGFPEYVGVVKDYLLVIEDKSQLQGYHKNKPPKRTAFVILWTAAASERVPARNYQTGLSCRSGVAGCTRLSQGRF